jgi:hypothetical protein
MPRLVEWLSSNQLLNEGLSGVYTTGFDLWTLGREGVLGFVSVCFDSVDPSCSSLGLFSRRIN